MGRRTYESIGRPLPGRQNIVISESLNEPPPGTDLAHSLDEAIHLMATHNGPAFIIGGAVLYTAALPRVEALHLTQVDAEVEGDAHLPPIDKSQWRLVEEVAHPQDENHALPFRFCTYRR
jgi:dihydrofolate reductase